MHWLLNTTSILAVVKMYEVLLVSVIYWLSLLVIILWLNHRLALLTRQVSELEAGRTDRKEPERE